jgi:hypothetical protein
VGGQVLRYLDLVIIVLPRGLTIKRVEENKNNEVIVDTADSGEFSFVGPDDKIHKLTGKGRQRDIWIRTQGGLKMKYHEELESDVQVDGKPIQ